MKILFAWTGVTSYMADCWRCLQSAAGVELKVAVENVCSGRAFDAERVFSGLDCTIVGGGAQGVGENVALERLLGGWTPDVVFAVGWHSAMVRKLVRRSDWRNVPKVCCFDMPWRWSLRCLAARWALCPFLRNYVAAYVPGRICARYAKWLGFSVVRTGLFGIDMGKFRKAQAASERSGFLYVGRMSVEKRVDLIEAAHRRYRELGGAWALDCYGQGGKFAQPSEMPRIYAEHACLLLASAFDPWPLVVLEAKAAGCEVIMSDRCGNRYELPDARVVRFGDFEAMAREMLRVEHECKYERAKCKVADDALERYDCRAWAERTLAFARELTGEGRLK